MGNQMKKLLHFQWSRCWLSPFIPSTRETNAWQQWLFVYCIRAFVNNACQFECDHSLFSFALFHTIKFVFLLWTFFYFRIYHYHFQCQSQRSTNDLLVARKCSKNDTNPRHRMRKCKLDEKRLWRRQRGFFPDTAAAHNRRRNHITTKPTLIYMCNRWAGFLFCFIFFFNFQFLVCQFMVN